MKVWILIDDQKSGPYHDFEVRSMISDREIEPEQLAWYEGLEEWLPVGEIELFEDAFPKEAEPTPDLPVDENNASDAQPTQPTSPEAEPPPLTREEYLEQKRKFTPEGEPIPTLEDGDVGVFLYRRFFARVFDLLVIYSGFYIFYVLQSRNPVEVLIVPENLMVVFFSWALLENFCTHFWGTTIGKALFGLRVERKDTDNLNLIQSILRTVLVVFLVMLGTSPIFFLFLFLSCIFFSKMRKALPWDIYSGAQVRGMKLTKMRIITIIVFFLNIVIITSILTPEHIQKEMELQRDKQWNELINKPKE